jgi:hypothetical protein
MPDSSPVPIGGKLPYSLELRTTNILDILSVFLMPHENEDNQDFRERLQQRLYNRCRPGFYHEMNEHFYLAYGDQRDGHGTQHYWRVFYDDTLKQQVESLAKGFAITAPRTFGGGENAPFEWGGLYLRSSAELAIAEELDRRGVLFFANVRGRVSTNKSPISELQSNGRVEIDFLVFNNGKAIILEVDGRQHNENGARVRDYAKDRLMLREGIQTARFTAQECLNATVDVVNEFLSCF